MVSILQTLNKLNKVQTINLDNYQPEAKSVVIHAQSFADESKHEQVEPIHILAQLVDIEIIRETFKKVGINIADFATALHKELSNAKKSQDGLSSISRQLENLLLTLEKTSKNDVGIEHLLIAVMHDTSGINILKSFNIKP